MMKCFYHIFKRNFTKELFSAYNPGGYSMNLVPFYMLVASGGYLVSGVQRIP